MLKDFVGCGFSLPLGFLLYNKNVQRKKLINIGRNFVIESKCCVYETLAGYLRVWRRPAGSRPFTSVHVPTCNVWPALSSIPACLSQSVFILGAVRIVCQPLASILIIYSSHNGTVSKTFILPYKMHLYDSL